MKKPRENVAFICQGGEIWTPDFLLTNKVEKKSIGRNTCDKAASDGFESAYAVSKREKSLKKHLKNKCNEEQQQKSS